MNLLRYTQRLNNISKKLTVILIAIVTVTSVKIQSASAMSLLPSAPMFSTATQIAYDAIQEYGFTIPKDEETEATDQTTEQTTKKYDVQYTRIAVVTAYNSVPWQTDATPCISADGSDICKLKQQGEESCAAALPFGTKVNIPGFGVCIVRDRLAPKYAYRIDIYMGGADQIQTAKKWGKRKLMVEVL